MLGEDTDEEIVEGSFNSKPVLPRLAVIAAGPIFNFVLAFILALFIVSAAGIDKPVISELMDGYPAVESGLQTGDVIKSVNGKDISIYREFMLYLYMNPGEELSISVERMGDSGSEILDYKVVPRYDEQEGRHIVGLAAGVRDRSSNILTTIQYAFYEVKYSIDSTISGLVHMIKGKAKAEQISGPVGIVASVGDTVDESMSYGFIAVLLTVANITMMLSATLGVMNLLPIPALDGGRILFLIVEAIIRKPLNRKIEAYIHFGGFVLLMLLMVFIMYNDIKNLFLK